MRQRYHTQFWQRITKLRTTDNKETILNIRNNIYKKKTNNYNTMIDSTTDHVIGARDHRVIVT